MKAEVDQMEEETDSLAPTGQWGLKSSSSLERRKIPKLDEELKFEH